jgi:hypothetical protein
VTSCGHRCCEIAGNSYHRHADPPDTCARCTALAREIDAVSLGQLVAEVVALVVPEIPGLPRGSELSTLVGIETTAVHRAARHDPQLYGLDADLRRTVLAGRVGISLAFGKAGHARR